MRDRRGGFRLFLSFPSTPFIYAHADRSQVCVIACKGTSFTQIPVNKSSRRVPSSEYGSNAQDELQQIEVPQSREMFHSKVDPSSLHSSVLNHAALDRSWDPVYSLVEDHDPDGLPQHENEKFLSRLNDCVQRTIVTARFLTAGTKLGYLVCPKSKVMVHAWRRLACLSS